MSVSGPPCAPQRLGQLVSPRGVRRVSQLGSRRGGYIYLSSIKQTRVSRRNVFAGHMLYSSHSHASAVVVSMHTLLESASYFLPTACRLTVVDINLTAN